MGLMMCQGLFGCKIVEVGMIQKDFGQMKVTLKVMVKMMEHMDNGQQFFVMDLVISLYRL